MRDCSSNTIFSTSEHNGVAERQNRSLIDMIRTMICIYHFPESHWVEDLKSNTYILNRIPSNSGPKAHFKLWTGSKSSINQFRL